MGKHDLVAQPSWRPVAKVVAVWATGAGATVVLAVVAELSDAVNQETVWGSLATLVLSGIAGYVKKNRARA